MTALIDMTRPPSAIRRRTTSTVRLGAVSYLNSKPLIEGLPELVRGAELTLDYPSRLADDLAAGRLDVALVPSVECLRHPDWQLISDACVAARGPVLSVKLYSRLPFGQIRTLALDVGSRTSAALARIMLAERFGVHPRLQPLPMGSASEDSTADALLFIGDRAMHPPREPFVATWDLGEEWSRWTGLPFVFAVWAARPGVATDSSRSSAIDEGLCRARDLGVEQIPQIARREAASLGISVDLAESYLRRNLHFCLGSAERNGLRLFRDLANAAGLLDESAPPTRCVGVRQGLRVEG